MEPVHDMDQVHQNIELDVHRIQVLEVLTTEKYVYLRAKEGDREYWVATGKMPLTTGAYYQYNEALIKKQFKSEALDREFETLYLVTRLIPDEKSTALNKANLSEALKNPDAQAAIPDIIPENPADLPKVHLSTLQDQKEAFEGQWVQVYGTCVKVNNGIMGRNWVHLAQEGTDTEVVVTTQAEVSAGQKVQFAAKVAIDRDFGSGYSYPLLLEQGQLLE